MKIKLTTTALFQQKLPSVILFAFEDEAPKVPASLAPLVQQLTKQEFHGADRQLALLHTAGRAGIAAARLLLVGLGKHADLTCEKTRRAFGVALKHMRAAGLDRTAVQVHCPSPEALQTVVEAAGLVSYRFTKFQEPDPRPALAELTICLPEGSDVKAAQKLVDQSQTIVESANYARDLANQPGNVVYPSVISAYARKLAKETGLKCTVLNRAKLEADGFGGLLAVGGGSAREPQLIALEYRGAKKSSAKPIALVGKALTFDSGGISIKPADKMDEMKFDKSGGCAVLGAMRAIAKLKLPLNVIGVIAAAENMPGASSYRPGDIVTSYKGRGQRAVTIEVLNTDAEGRVVLGDALVYASEREPQAIIDLATLTGACVIALGSAAAGVLGNNEELLEKLRSAGETTGERLWPLPLWQDYKDKVKSDIADIKNSAGREAGAITGAAFLEKYVGKIPWAHLDIAGTAWTTEEQPYRAKGATGFGVRLLLETLTRWNEVKKP